MGQGLDMPLWAWAAEVIIFLGTGVCLAFLGLYLTIVCLEWFKGE